MQGVEGQNLFKKKFLRPRSLLFRGYLGLQGTRGTRAVGYKELNLFELNINIFVLSPGPQDSWLPPASDQMLLPLPRDSPGLSTHSWPTPPFALAAELLFSPNTTIHVRTKARAHVWAWAEFVVRCRPGNRLFLTVASHLQDAAAMESLHGSC